MKIFILLFAFFALLGCQKSNNKESKTENYAFELTNFFKSYDTTILKEVMQSGEDKSSNTKISGANLIYMKNKNAELIRILQWINPVSYADCKPDDPYVAVAGMMELVIQSTSDDSNR